MKFSAPLLAFLALSLSTNAALAFTPHIDSAVIVGGFSAVRSKRELSLSSTLYRSSNTGLDFSAINDVVDDCGCSSSTTPNSIIFSGRPTAIARTSDPRQAIRNGSIFTVKGVRVTMDNLLKGIGSGHNEDPVSIVVFLRSLGWPLCQEFILQWSKRKDELDGLGVKLVMVSIGKPETGKELIDHLEIQNGADYLFVDPENVLYDALHLNKGVKETFFTPSTPFAFLDRFTKKNGMRELMEVLSKWNKAVYIPPKRDQAFNQGGTFIFDGESTVFAHYDESTGAHSDIQLVINLAKGRVEARSRIRMLT